MTYTHVFRARERGCRIRLTHVLTRSDCVHTRDDTVRLAYASRFVRVIYSSHIVSIKLGTVTPSVVVDWQYTNDRTVQLQWRFPHSSRCRFLAVLPALVQTMLSGGATRTGSDAATCVLPSDAARMSLGVATSLSSKFFETMLFTPAWISFWRCNPHAPPFSLAALAVLCARARTMPRMRPTLPRRQAFLSSFGTASRRCSDGVSHAS